MSLRSRRLVVSSVTDNQKPVTPKTSEALKRRLELHVFPLIGDMKVTEIKTKDISQIIERLDDRKTHEVASRVLQICSRVFRYGILKEYCETDPTSAIQNEVGRSVAVSKPKHFAAVVEPDKVGLLMRHIEGYPFPTIRLAMKLSALTFCRPGEIRYAEWDEFDLKKKVWVIPAERMKMRREHMVPLSRQAVDIVKELRETALSTRFLFANARAPKSDRPMSDADITVALKAMGYKDTMTAHGFRSMASTLLNENGVNRDWIEMQLAHVPKNKIRGAYNRAQYWDDRVVMVQWYADLLDSLRDGTPPPVKP